MQRSRATALLLAGFALEETLGSEATPVQKVIELLGSMLEKGKLAKHEEQVQFAAFKQFCDDTSGEKKRSITENSQKIEILNADIAKSVADSHRLAKEITEHDADISIWQGDTKAATKVRQIEKADYDAMHADYSESVDALQRAIAVLKKQSHDRKQASLTQVAALKLIPEKAKRAINLFLQQDPEEEGLAVAAPDANAYESSSGKIVEMLEKLQDKFVEERTTLEKEEMNSKHAFQMLTQDLTSQIGQATGDRTEKSEAKSKALQSKADAEGDLTDTSTILADDQKYLGDFEATCGQKASDFEDRQKLRADEIQAIEKAMEIIGGEAVSGNADKHLPALLQSRHKTFAQLRADARSPVQQRASDFLQNRANELNSRILSALASRVAQDPFSKVKKMIKDLIVRLMEESNEEAEHKGWCDTELSTNEQTRKEKTNAVESLHAEIDELQASIIKLTEDVTELSKAVSELDAAIAEATEIRQVEKAKNADTIKDAGDAQLAVAQALVVLKEFYAKAAESTALVQQKQPEVFDESYQGMSSSSGGVIGMLEVIESDFARLEADTDAGEAAAQSQYDRFMTDSQVDKAEKQKTNEHKSAKRQDEEQSLQQKKADLDGTQKELDAALSYYDKLKPSCVDAGTSYEDRVGRRKEEIESLQEALKILNGEDIA